LDRIDKIIAAHISGNFMFDHLIDMPVLPIEPCTVNEGLLNHIRFRQNLLQEFGEYPFSPEQNAPLIIHDEDALATTSDFSIFNDHPLHLYVSQAKCTEDRVRLFHNLIITTAARFRDNFNRLVEQRRTLVSYLDVFGGEEMLKDLSIRKNVYLLKQLNFVFKNRLQIEDRIMNLHFAIESLRSQLLRMFDEMFARRMGWGYSIQNPGHKFIVFIQHQPYVKSYNWDKDNVESNTNFPPSTPNSNSNSKNSGKGTKKSKPKKSKRNAADVFNANCIIEISSIDQLSIAMNKPSSLDFQIFHFTENEKNLKSKIESLKNLFNSWLKVSHGYYKSNYYDNLYKQPLQMFNNLLNDVLMNPKYGRVETKIPIIEKFTKVLLKQMDYSILWYWDPRLSVNKILLYMQSIYDWKYPQKPQESKFPFHGEL
jgi:hypothetical protein